MGKSSIFGMRVPTRFYEGVCDVTITLVCFLRTLVPHRETIPPKNKLRDKIARKRTPLGLVFRPLSRGFITLGIFYFLP